MLTLITDEFFIFAYMQKASYGPIIAEILLFSIVPIIVNAEETPVIRRHINKEAGLVIYFPNG
jgi:hypothetical protein